MSESRLLPAWRPIGTCDDGRCAFDGCNQNPTFDSEWCSYHVKMTGTKPLITQNGAESRSTPAARSLWRTRKSRAKPSVPSSERAATLRGGTAQNSGQRGKYPWPGWFDGTERVLTAGIDFHNASAENVATLARRTAASRNYAATIRQSGDMITITPHKKAVA